MKTEEFKFFKQEQFSLYAPERIQDVQSGDLPAPVAKFFSRASAHLIRSSALPIDRFDRLMLLDDGSGSIAYFAQHDKYYDHIDTTDRVVYEVDLDADGKIIMGFGEFFVPLDGENHLPSVMRSRTESEYQEKGLGTRRLLAMNAVALREFGKPLNSDSLLSYAALRTWKRIVRLGLAEEYPYQPLNLNEPTPRFRFLTQTDVLKT